MEKNKLEKFVGDHVFQIQPIHLKKMGVVKVLIIIKKIEIIVMDLQIEMMELKGYVLNVLKIVIVNLVV